MASPLLGVPTHFDRTTLFSSTSEIRFHTLTFSLWRTSELVVAGFFMAATYNVCASASLEVILHHWKNDAKFIEVVPCGPQCQKTP